MLRITLDPWEWYDEEKEEFVTDPPLVINMEHSLLSVSQWESKWKKALLPLLTNGGLTSEELLDYFGCMVVDPPTLDITQLLIRFSPENMKKVLEYIDDPQTATVITDRKQSKSKNRLITSELIYCWMIGWQMDKSYETWNINRLLTLIRVVSIELNPNKEKMSSRDAAAMQRSINEINKAKLKTKG